MVVKEVHVRKLPPVPKKMLEVLADGEYHTKVELAEAANSVVGLVKNKMSVIRRALPEGMAIICELQDRRIGYRLVHTCKGTRLQIGPRNR